MYRRIMRNFNQVFVGGIAMSENIEFSPETTGTSQTPSATRRTFLKAFAGAGAAVSLSGKLAWANGEIGFWAKDLPPEKLTEIFSTMLRIRWFERTMVDKMLTEPGYRGYNHFYPGQEAVAVGVCSALNNAGAFEEVDLIYSTHRPSGHAIAKGVDIKKMAAEYDFRATGLNKGYAAEMHIADKSVGFMGADGMIGPGPVMAAGSAFAIKARGSKQVVVNFGGDGTYATPAFHGALNNAALLKLPFIYVLENNLYHQYAHYSYSCPMKDIAEAAGPYGIPGVVVDGQDELQVYNAAKEAVDRARAGEGPTLIEAKTYRYYNHWGAPGAKPGVLGAFGYDPLAITSFRPEREVRAWLARDPIDIFRKTLLNWEVMDQAKADSTEAAVKQEAIDAFAWADEQPLCDPEHGLKNVFVEGTVPARQLA
jgi:pyruvate dehydrogenase E1 component alpha subunit